MSNRSHSNMGNQSSQNDILDALMNNIATTTSLSNTLDLSDDVSSIYSSHTAGTFYVGNLTENLIDNSFNKNTRKLSEESFRILLETVKEDNHSKYIENIANIVTRPGFRMLSDEYLTEIALDIAEAEKKYGFAIEDYYDLDNFPSFKLLRKIN